MIEPLHPLRRPFGGTITPCSAPSGISPGVPIVPFSIRSLGILVNTPDFDESIGLLVNLVLDGIHDAVGMALVYPLSSIGGTVWFQPISVLTSRTAVEKVFADFEKLVCPEFVLV